jgi:germination protein M
LNERVKHDGPVWPWIVGAAILASALSIGTYYFFQMTSKPPKPPIPAAPSPAFKEVTGIQGAKVSLKVYFPTPDGKGLSSEQRDIAQSPDESQEVKELVAELIRGPLSPDLTPALPPETRVKSAFIDPATGTAYIDFSREVQTQFPGGAWTETLAIYSVVNTLTEDFPDIKQVQFLVEGNVTESLAGHIDTTRPFAPRTALNKS